MTELFGLSLALGAFLAGIMLGETEYRHQIETDIRPFRDVLMGLFFISIGAFLNLSVLLTSWHWIVLLVFGLVVGKGLLTILLTRAAGYESGVAFRTGVVLAQGGEFGFALLAVAVLNGVLDPNDVQAIMMALVVSMGLAPIIIRYNGVLTKKIFAGTYTANRRKLARDLETAAYVLNDHVIICGFGRIGQNLANFLYTQGFTYAALDLDPWLIKEATAAGETVFYGDATHAEILKALGLSRARAVVITCSDVPTAEKIIYAVRGLDKKIAVIARTVDDSHLEALEQAGATEIIPEAVEASMMLATYLLQRLNVPIDEVMRLVENARADHYRHLRSFFHGSEMESIEEVDQYRLHTVVLPLHSYAVGRSIGSLLLEEHKVSVYAIKRGAIRGEAPDDDMVLKAGDTVVLQGAPESIEYAENKLLVG
jgi:CPA2 family monovalent cation:H+ antiporter-2